jgi:hypothetical protein
LKLWRLFTRTSSTCPDVCKCSRYVGPCEVIAITERQARMQARGAFCLPVAPGCWRGVCPWLEDEHVGSELIDRTVRLVPGSSAHPSARKRNRRGTSIIVSASSNRAIRADIATLRLVKDYAGSAREHCRRGHATAR